MVCLKPSKDELLTRELPEDLDRIIALAICIDADIDAGGLQMLGQAPITHRGTTPTSHRPAPLPPIQ